MESRAASDYPRETFFKSVQTTILGLLGKLPVSPPEEVAKWIKEGAVLLDVRTGIEARRTPVRGATNIPLSKLKGHLSDLPRNKAFVIYCARGGRAERAMKLLHANGLKAINGGGYKAILKILATN
jgi:phage shock protein E